MFNQSIFDEATPDGLSLLHHAINNSEAEMIRQVLVEVGFHPEYVATAATGVLGTSGSTAIYVPTLELKDASAFLGEYFAAPPIFEDEAAADA
jgi:hypothetical protein